MSPPVPSHRRLAFVAACAAVGVVSAGARLAGVVGGGRSGAVVVQLVAFLLMFAFVFPPIVGWWGTKE